MADSKHTLEIVSKLKDEASGKLKAMGVAGEKAGKRTQTALKGVQVEADKSGKSMLDAGQAGSKAAGIAGAGFASLSAGMAAGAATAENMEASMVSVGAAVGAAFAAGGPVGAGLALAATGMGLLIGKSKEGAKEAKALGESFVKMSAEAVAAIDGIDTRLNSLFIDILGLDAELEGKSFDRVGAQLEEGFRKTKEELSDAEKEMAKLVDRGRTISLLNQDNLRSWYEAVEQQKKVVAGLKDEVYLSKERLIAYRKVKAAREEEREAGAELVESETDLVSLGAQRLEIETEIVDVYAQELAAVEQQKKANEQLAAVQEKHRQAQERQTQRIIDANRSLQDRIDILNAETGKQRDLIRLEQERRDLLDQGLDSLKVREYYEARLLEISEAYADTAEKGAAVEMAKADAAERTTQAHKQDLDITKKFAAAPGTNGVFGFGAGTAGFGGFGGGQSRVRKRRRTAGVAAPAGGGAGAAAAGGGGAGGALPDPSPHIVDAAGSIADLKPVFDKFTEVSKQLAKETRLTLDRGWDKVNDFAAVVGSEIKSMRAKIQSLEKNLARAGDLAVAGGS